MKICSIKGCERKHYAKGLCHLHYCREHKSAWQETKRRYMGAYNNLPEVRERYKKYMKVYCSTPKYKESERQRSKKRYTEDKKIILEHYGGNPPKCACCGESRYEFLSIDHINGGGRQHRKTVHARSFYLWLIKNNFPEEYRILCFNCNCARGFFGYCPHEKEREKKNVVSAL
jgi:hypothetical protein